MSLVQTEDHGRVRHLVLNRPEKRNALNEEVVQGVLEALDEVRSDPSLRVVVTRGAGAAYSAGLDLYYLREASAREPGDWDRPTATVSLFRAVRAFPRVSRKSPMIRSANAMTAMRSRSASAI